VKVLSWNAAKQKCTAEYNDGLQEKCTAEYNDGLQEKRRKTKGKQTHKNVYFSVIV
jgi:hypothetical protein